MALQKLFLNADVFFVWESGKFRALSEVLTVTFCGPLCQTSLTKLQGSHKMDWAVGKFYLIKSEC